MTTMNTSFDDKTRLDQENMFNMNNDPILADKKNGWKVLSIGGAFGVLLAGGWVYAGTRGKDAYVPVSTDSEVDDSLSVIKEGTDYAAEAPLVHDAKDDPVMLDDNGKPIIPASQLHQTAVPHIQEATTSNTHDETPSLHAEVITPSSQRHTQSEPGARTINAETVNTESANVETVHEVEVNIMDIDDSLSFGDAFALARSEMGPGCAFEWRGGVYSTFNEQEWSSLSTSEKQDFVDVAVREWAEMGLDGHDSNPSSHETAHTDFVEGSLLTHNTNQTIVIDDDDNAMVIDDDDVIIIEGSSSSESNDPVIITLDDNLENTDSLDVSDFDEIGGDIIEDLSDELGTIASIINEGMDTIGGSEFIIGSETETSDSNMPDYVANADTTDIV